MRPLPILGLLLAAALPTSAQTPAATATPDPAPPTAPAVVYDRAHLNPAFILSPADVAKAIRKGQEDAKKGRHAGDLLQDTSRLLRGGRAVKKGDDEPSASCLGLNGFGVVFHAFALASSGQPPDFPPETFRDGLFLKRLNFTVSLRSPQSTAGSDMERRAGEGDVRVTDFLLTDDRGDLIRPVMPTDNASAPAATPSAATPSTIAYPAEEYTPWSQQHPYYAAEYTVSFPLFDAGGSPLIGPDVKTITLHVTTPNGEQTAIYDLKAPRL